LIRTPPMKIPNNMGAGNPCFQTGKRLAHPLDLFRLRGEIDGRRQGDIGQRFHHRAQSPDST